MTLKEKFQNIHSDYLPLSNNQKNECEKIADEFAIGFANWLSENYYAIGDKDKWVAWDNDKEPKTSKELLEIYKQEKGL